jgi:formyl-CoA transferase/CoA:oxalate CoA-transferase
MTLADLGADVIKVDDTHAWGLAATADVVVETFRPEPAGRLGFGYAAVAEISPRVVYTSISGYGQTGPMRGEAGYDAIAQALSGVMNVTGDERDR